MKTSLLRFAPVLGILAAICLILAGTAFAQTDTSWCVSPDPAVPVGCATVTLSPAALKGDFYLGETLLAQGQNPANLILPPGSKQVSVKNIQSTDPGFGTLYVYSDATAYLFTTAGKVSNSTVYPTKKFIRGTLKVTCDARNTTATDILSCIVSIDTVAQAEPLAPGASHEYVLDPGSHAVSVAIVGDSAKYWTPATFEQKASIFAGGTSSVRATFNKMGHLIINNNQPGVLADYYVDGTLVIAQAAGTDLWVLPYKSIRIDAKNFSDPAAKGAWTYYDATSYTFFSPGTERTVTMRLTKKSLVGYFSLTCKIDGTQPGQIIFCQTTIDGAAVENVAPGFTKRYPLAPGPHHVTVVVGPTDQYTSDPYNYDIVIVTGQTVSQTATWHSNGPGGGGPPPTATPQGGMGTVIAINQTTDNSTCRVAVAGMGQVYNVDAPTSMQIPAGSYSWQVFFGNKQTTQNGFTLPPGGTCAWVCYDEYVTYSCP